MSVRVLVVVLGLAIAFPAAAAEPLTLEMALSRAEEVSAAVKLQAMSSEAAEARWLADPRAGAPSIRVGVRDLYAPSPWQLEADPPEVVTRLRLPLPRPWDLATAARQGRATVQREDAELDALRERVRLAVTIRFHALPLLRDAVASADELTRMRTAHLALVEKRREEGLATALDWLDSEEERRDAADRRASRAADVEAVDAELRVLLQWPAEEPIEIVPDEPRVAEAEIPAVDSLLEGLTDRDPAVREAEAEIARAEARLRRQQLGSLPWLDWAQAGAVFRQDRQVAFDVGVAVDVPIYMWSPARTRAAAQELAGAKLGLHEVERAAEQRLARRVRAAEAARERWIVQKDHHDAISLHAAPLMELADPLLKIELEARIVRAELRLLAALVDLVEELDRLDGAAHR